MKLYNSSRNYVIAEDANIADNFVKRTFGLIPKSYISNDEALVIKPCFSIHTFFMKFEIDVLFVNRKNKIVGLYENVSKNKILPLHLTSAYVVELKAGQISDKKIEKGDIIQLYES